MSTTQQNNKRIAKNTLLLYIRMLFMMAVSLYTSRLVLDILGEVNFGIYNVVGGFVTMFAVISGAMTTATQRFLSFEIGKGSQGNVHSLFSTAVMIHVILAGIILVLAETIGLWFLNTQMNFPPERHTAANWVYQFSVLTFLINVISVPYNAAIVAYEKMTAFAYVSIIEVILKLVVVYLLIVSPFDQLIVYSILLAIIAITIRVIYGIYCGRNFKDCHCDWKWNKTEGKQMMSFVSWNLIGSVAGIAKEQGINVVLNIFFGAAINAARGVAYQVFGALNSFVNNFQLAMNPQIVKQYAAGNKSDMFLLVFRGSKFSFLLLWTLSLPVILEAPFILSIWLKAVPQYTVIFLRLVLITALIDSLSGTLISSMHASGKVRDYQIVVGGLSLLTLPVAYIFFKLGYPPQTAMAVSVVISIVCYFARMLLLNRTIKLPVKEYLWSVTLKIVIVAAVSLLLPLFAYLSFSSGWQSFITVCTLSVVSTCSISYVIGLSKRERAFFNKKIHDIIIKIRK